MAAQPRQEPHIPGFLGATVPEATVLPFVVQFLTLTGSGVPKSGGLPGTCIQPQHLCLKESAEPGTQCQTLTGFHVNLEFQEKQLEKIKFPECSMRNHC